MLATGLIVAYGYFIEFFMAFVTAGNKFDVFLAKAAVYTGHTRRFTNCPDFVATILTPAIAVVSRSVRRNIPSAVRDVADHQHGDVAGAFRDSW